ncbi:unnamed protein product [Schistosoma curassoni]|uniref:Endo/exonuclease/phosphatase domain-containing protein n=1 Tax=Schistosoma curassoni TaxID=6186 RepID=A0A183KEE9_9TREM|nr:unnamed protein product [Schistosoma curassoni]
MTDPYGIRPVDLEAECLLNSSSGSVTSAQNSFLWYLDEMSHFPVFFYLDPWNVRTMWDTGRAFQIAAEMRRYNLEVLGISETHWTQVEQQRLTSGELLLYSVHEEENAPHTQGVALMLSKEAQNALIGWKSHGPRIIKASFKTKEEGISMNVIQCYAPINDYNEETKDQFYNRLQSIIKKCPTKDLTILMGDFNAKVGTDNTGYKDIIGRHGLGERNGNGSQQETLDPGFVLLGTRQQGVPVILRELVLPGGIDLVSPSFTVRDVTTELSEP